MVRLLEFRMTILILFLFYYVSEFMCIGVFFKYTNNLCRAR